jgi:ABC-type methionine transport system permease subunit
LQGVPRPGLAAFNKSVEDWANLHNPLFHGANANLLSMIPFLILMVLLYLVGRELLLTSRDSTVSRR